MSGVLLGVERKRTDRRSIERATFCQNCTILSVHYNYSESSVIGCGANGIKAARPNDRLIYGTGEASMMMCTKLGKKLFFFRQRHLEITLRVHITAQFC